MGWNGSDFIPFLHILKKQMSKLKIEWYTTTFNEEVQLPFAIEYWKRFIQDDVDFHVNVFDNMSTDNTVNILSQYPWITIFKFDTRGQMDEEALTYIRNNCWINSDADWVMMTDLDEVFYSKDIISELKSMKEQGIGAVACKWYALTGDNVPEHKDGVLLHQQIGRGYQQFINHRDGFKQYGKIQLFNPKLAKRMNYSMGMHYAFPGCPIVFNPNIYQFHFDKGFGADYKVKKRRELWDRLKPTLRQRGVCEEYGWAEEKIRKDYQDCIDKSVDISSL